MIKRIAVTLLFTGTAHLFSIFALKFIAHQTSHKELSEIGEVDSMAQFIIAVIALGLQSAAMRNIATSENWQVEYSRAQTARFTLGLLLVLFCAFAFSSRQYLIFAAAPVFAMNSDYAMYGRGYPIAGAFIAFLRVFVPFLIVIILTLLSFENISRGYFIGIVSIFFLTNILTSKILKTHTFHFPDAKSLKLYFDSIPLGIVLLAYYFLGLGILLVAKYFYTTEIIAVAFIGLKFYVIYKGILRVIHQAFMKDMINESVCFKVDQISILAGLLFAGSVLIFPESFINVFFGSKFLENKSFFILLAVTAFVFSLFLSMTTKTLLEKMDTIYMKISCSAVIISFVTLPVLFVINPGVNNIAVSLLAGELFLALGLCILAKEDNFVLKRLGFVLQNVALLIIPGSVRIFIGDSPIPFLCSIACVALLMLVVHLKKFEFTY